MILTASDYYKKYDAVVSSLSEALAKIQAVEAEAVNRGLRVFWRGQIDHRWGLTSSLVRQVSEVTTPTDKLLNSVEDSILKDGNDWITELSDRLYTEPLACLAYMQHHGIPTRLVDFTRDAWMAVFFAVETPDDVDGRLFALLVGPDDVLTTTPAGTPWRSWKTNEIRIWDPVACKIEFPRISAQHGVFALGRLPSTRPHRIVWDDVLQKERSLLAEEVRRMLSIPFKLCSSDPIPARAASPIGITFRLHVDKESVRRDLSKAGSGRRACPAVNPISHRNVYPDADGMRTHSKLLQGLEKGMIIV